MLTPPGFVTALIDHMRRQIPKRRSRPRRCACASAEVRALQAEEAAGRVGGTSVVTDDRRPRALFLEAADPLSARRARSTASCRRCACTSASTPTGREALATYVATPVSELELLEGLEQLRFLAAGIPVDVVEVETPPFTLARAQQSRGRRADRGGARRSRARMSYLDTLDPQYRLILCDIWGVVHDGVDLYPDAAERLRQWRGQGRTVILITNAPRTAEAVEAQLGRIGLPRDCWDGIATSGEAGIAALTELAHPTGFLGTTGDRADPRRAGASRFVDDGFTDLAVHRPR